MTKSPRTVAFCNRMRYTGWCQQVRYPKEKIMSITTRMGDHTLTLSVSEYVSGQGLAIMAIDMETEEIYAPLSTNISGCFPIYDGGFFISEDNPARELVAHLVEEEIITPTDNTVTYGNFGSTAREYTLNEG